MLLCAAVGVCALGLPLATPSTAHADEKPATIRVTLPADATLTIDGEPTQSTSADRQFQTPPLETGKEFHYTLRATVVRGDDTVSVERRVAVRAGQESDVTLTMPGAPAENPTFYYSPSAPAYYRGGPVRGYVGPARNNWKPDFSDPFYMGGCN
ncbi:MAG TPA: TIGR03000 domain-containing protein [Gemmataceae bacterium]|nr:TIGR03000 domain-containing protein [Gemmataceae bacterium]